MSVPVFKRRLLVSNDDGPKSPLLAPFIRALGGNNAVDVVRVVVPSEEQSWISQAVTRFRPLFTTPYAFPSDGGEIPGYLVSGTPADCVGLGLSELFPGETDLVVSGINVGTNATLPFYLNSGTVGAARQALTFGVKAIALSTMMPDELFAAWRNDDFRTLLRHKEDWERVCGFSAQICVDLVDAEFWNEVDLYSVNIPWAVSKETPRVLSTLERSTYLPLYKRLSDASFTHHFQGFDRDPGRSKQEWPSDLDVLQSGCISVTPIRYNLMPRSMTALAAKLNG